MSHYLSPIAAIGVLLLLAAVTVQGLAVDSPRPKTFEELLERNPPVGIDKTKAYGVLGKLSGYEKAKCIDGSPGAYYLFPGKHTDKWIFFMDGGGVCTFPEDCYNRSSTVLGSSSSYPPVMPASELPGFLLRDCLGNPEFCEYTIVFIQYCDGALFSGAREEPLIHNNKSLYFRGNEIKKAVLEDAKDLMMLYAVKEVVISGCSAGAFATYLHSDDMVEYIKANVPTVTKFGAIPFSGFFLLSPNMDNQPVIQDMIKSMYNMTNGTAVMNPACLADFDEDEQWKCGFSQYAYNYSTVPTFVVNSKTDAWQIACEVLATSAYDNRGETCVNMPGYVMGVCPQIIPKDGTLFPFAKCNESQMTPIFDYQYTFLDILEATNGYKRSQNGAFIMSCFTHCGGLTNQMWDGFSINATLLSEAVSLWWKFLGDVQEEPNQITSEGSAWIYNDCDRSEADKKDGYECNLLCAHPLLKSGASASKAQLVGGKRASFLQPGLHLTEDGEL